MSGYILSDSKTFEIFVRTEKALKSSFFPIMKKFAENEIDFILKTVETHLGEKDRIVEMGVGSGRVVKKLSKFGFPFCGFDNDPFFIKYCKDRGLDVFLSDATKAVPKRQKNKYKMAIIAFNTLFNLPENIREKWIFHAYNLLDKGGFLVIIAYSSENFQKSMIKKRVEFYQYVLDPPKGYHVEFFDNSKEKGIHMLDEKNRVKWFSLWKTKQDIRKETDSWKGFDLVSITSLECKIAFGIVLQKIT